MNQQQAEKLVQYLNNRLSEWLEFESLSDLDAIPALLTIAAQRAVIFSYGASGVGLDLEAVNVHSERLYKRLLDCVSSEVDKLTS